MRSRTKNLSLEGKGRREGGENEATTTTTALLLLLTHPSGEGRPCPLLGGWVGIHLLSLPLLFLRSSPSRNPSLRAFHSFPAEGGFVPSSFQFVPLVAGEWGLVSLTSCLSSVCLTSPCTLAVRKVFCLPLHISSGRGRHVRLNVGMPMSQPCEFDLSMVLQFPYSKSLRRRPILEKSRVSGLSTGSATCRWGERTLVYV